MPNENELIPMTMDELRRLATPGVFIALDVDNPEDGSDEGSNVRLVGTFMGWADRRGQGLRSLLMKSAIDNHEMDVLDYSIMAAFYAPMGYRP